jgi:serine/threonine protein kinase
MEKSCLKKYLTENELIDILHQITQGLNHLKKFGISHQSIRSSNLSVDNNNSVKIIDPLAKISLNNYNRVKSNLVNYPKEIYLSP